MIDWKRRRASRARGGRVPRLILLVFGILAGPAFAQPAPSVPPPRPALLVVISVDHLGADLFAQYRRHFTGGLARMLEGAVFPSGYQAHAATETCPGHSTILTGAHPARTGIIANYWHDRGAPREDVHIYCMEDERVPGSTSEAYTVSPVHLLVPTLGDLMSEADPDARRVSVAGKDRSAVLLAGHVEADVYWPGDAGFTTYAGGTRGPELDAINAAIAAGLARPRAASAMPAACAPYSRAIPIGEGRSVGTGLFARAAGDRRGFMTSPDADRATLAFARALVEARDLGRSGTTDLLTIGLAATDYVGHYFGTQGVEMCAQLLALDTMLGELLAMLDARGAPYAVALSADHGGLDLTERQDVQAAPDAARIDPALGAMGAALAAELGLPSPALLQDGGFGDIYVAPTVPEQRRDEVLRAAIERFDAHPQVYAVWTREQILATPMPTRPPGEWSLIERARASFHPDRSGDFVVLLEPRVTPIATSASAVATHGSPWDYDRRVPIVFWQSGRPGFEQPLGVATADIMPTLAALIGLDISGRELDGRCLDLDPGAGTTCPN